MDTLTEQRAAPFALSPPGCGSSVIRLRASVGQPQERALYACAGARRREGVQQDRAVAPDRDAGCLQEVPGAVTSSSRQTPRISTCRAPGAAARVNAAAPTSRAIDCTGGHQGPAHDARRRRHPLPERRPPPGARARPKITPPPSPQTHPRPRLKPTRAAARTRTRPSSSAASPPRPQDLYVCLRPVRWFTARRRRPPGRRSPAPPPGASPRP